MSDSPIYIIISGPVGVGKTSLMCCLSRMFTQSSSTVIKEYIDYYPHLGQCLLEANTHQTIPAIEFQRFILMCFKDQLEKARQFKYVLCERSPLESIGIFSEIEQEKGRLTRSEFNRLKDEANKLQEQHHIDPVNEAFVVNLDSGIFTPRALANQLFNIITQLHGSQTKTIYVSLHCDESTQIERIVQRGRSSEHNYDVNYMRKVNERYEIFFN